MEDDDKKFSTWKAVKSKEAPFQSHFQGKKNEQKEWSSSVGSSRSQEQDESDYRRQTKNEVKSKFWNQEMPSPFLQPPVSAKKDFASPEHDSNNNNGQRMVDKEKVINPNSFSRPIDYNERYK